MTSPWPTWLREIDLALPITAQFVVTGNIHDLHLTGEAAGGFSTTVDALRECLAGNGYDLVFRFDPQAGIVLDHAADGADVDELFPKAHLNKLTAATPSRLADLVRRAGTQDDYLVAILIEDSSEL